MAQRSGRRPNLAEAVRSRIKRRAASGRNLPHGRRSSNIRREPLLPGARRRQRIRDRCQRARHQRRLQSRADHHGQRVSRVGSPGENLERPRPRLMRKYRYLWVAAPFLLALLLLPASSVYYHSTGGEGCARCHEIRQPFDLWRESTHRSVSCSACHGDSFTTDLSFHLSNARRVVKHIRGDVPEQIRIKGFDVVRMLDRCKTCHRQEFADWQAGPHSSAFSKILLDQKHNHQRLLMDDCLRCHGSYYEGGIRQLVAPLDTRGPWQIADPDWANAPVIPCFACHQVHRHGEPLAKPAQARPRPATGEEIERPSLAMFDRRELAHIAAVDLPLPAMLDGLRPVKVSPD